MKASGHQIAAFWVLLLASKIAFADQSLAKQTISIAACLIPGILDETPEATYSSILNELSRRTGIDLTVEYHPPNRVRALFEEEKADCITPIDRDSFPKYEGFYQTHSLYVAKAYVFTLPGHRIRAKVADLIDITVGAELGIQYGSVIEGNVNLMRVRADKSRCKKRKKILI
ncbi:MAG: hypothetical protein V7750_14215 [Sneathiella sp.]